MNCSQYSNCGKHCILEGGKMKSKEKILKGIKSRKDGMMFFCLYILAIGLVGLMFACGSLAIIGSLDNDKYLSNPDIPYSQLDNATYTYTKENLSDLDTGLTEIVYLTVIISVASASCFAVMVVTYDKRELHILTCTPVKGVKYCPECGVKIAYLKKLK